MSSDSTSAEPSLPLAVRLFNEREYFACHDVLEELWGETVGEDRDFLQGLLHAAVSLFHLSEGNPAGAHKMHASTLRYLSPYPDRFQGVDLAQLRIDLTECFASARAGQTSNLSDFPVLIWSSADE
jgi:predicted metal-dependent hydrolase